jgi:hypothetical protein
VRRLGFLSILRGCPPHKYASLHAIENLLRLFLKIPPLTPRQPELSAISYIEIGARLEETANNNEKEV